jgi:hypothetical protein
VPSRAFADYLAASLERIEGDVREVYALLRRTLGSRAMRLDVGGEIVWVRDDGVRLVVAEPDDGGARAAVETRTTRRAIVALADGDVTLEEAVTEGRVELRGSVEDLEAGMEALAAYLNGAARCPELLGLMDEFRREAAEGAG